MASVARLQKYNDNMSTRHAMMKDMHEAAYVYLHGCICKVDNEMAECCKKAPCINTTALITSATPHRLSTLVRFFSAKNEL